MKSLKFDHQLAQAIAAGTKTSTWRINDEKELSVNDKVVVIDKVDAQNKNSWNAIGELTINKVVEQRLGEVDIDGGSGHEAYTSREEMYQFYRQYYGSGVGPETLVKVVWFTFKPYKEGTPFEQIEAKNTTHFTEVNMFGDGGSRGNPGPSASGFVLLDMNNNIIETNGEYLGITTNN